MPRRLPKYCVEDVDRHGTIRIYLRRNGRKIRLLGTPWTPEFMAAYDDGLRRLQPTAEAPAAKRAAPGTLRWLAGQWFASAETAALDATTRAAYRRIVETILEETIAPDRAEKFADMPIARVTAKAVKAMRDRKIAAGAKEAGNARVKAMRGLFRFAVEADLAASNPAADVAYLKTKSQGHHTWTVEEVRRFEARHPIGSMARLAMALMLYTGARRSDAVRLGPQHMSDGWLRWTAYKNRNRSPIEIEVPILPALEAVISATKRGHLAFLVTKFGKPYSMAGFSGQFRDWCDQAGLPHCSAHGLRKAGATIAAEHGASERQLMAIFGWVEAETAAIYTRKADRRRMAGNAMGLISVGQTEYKGVPPAAEIASGGTKTP